MFSEQEFSRLQYDVSSEPRIIKTKTRFWVFFFKIVLIQFTSSYGHFQFVFIMLTFIKHLEHRLSIILMHWLYSYEFKVSRTGFSESSRHVSHDVSFSNIKISNWVEKTHQKILSWKSYYAKIRFELNPIIFVELNVRLGNFEFLKLRISWLFLRKISIKIE